MNDNTKSIETEIEDMAILATASEPIRCHILREASELTAGDRNATYGDPVRNMQHIADIFNAWTGLKLTARHVAQLHVCTKMARRTTSPTHRDSYVDAAAYTGIELECAMQQEKDNG